MNLDCNSIEMIKNTSVWKWCNDWIDYENVIGWNEVRFDKIPTGFCTWWIRF